jgi:hypothetical protein
MDERKEAVIEEAKTLLEKTIYYWDNVVEQGLFVIREEDYNNLRRALHELTGNWYGKIY